MALPARVGDFRLDRASIRVAATEIGPVRVGDRVGLMRPPRLSDGPAWRATCLREEDRLRDSFGVPGESWSRTVSLVAWADRVAHQRAAARAGTLVPYVLARDDGSIDGEISFAIDPRTGTAEASLWIAADVPKVLRTWMFGMSMLRIFGLPQPIDRVVAPVARGNPGPTKLFELLGFTHEATARQLRPFGDRFADHDIWWLERTDSVLSDFGRLLASARVAS